MNRREFIREYYKEISIKHLDDGIIVVNLWKDKERENDRHVQVMFAYGKAYYTGDMGTYVFGRDIGNIFEFFKGDETNPTYWQEKCEASSEPIWEEDIDVDKAVELLEEWIDERDFSESEREEVNEAFDYLLLESNCIRAYDTIRGFIERWTYDDGTSDWIVNQSKKLSGRYDYACEVLQFVSNNLDKWTATINWAEEKK